MRCHAAPFARFLALLLAGVVISIRAFALEKADVQIFGDVYINQRVLEVTKSDSKNPRMFAGVAELLETSRFNIVNFEGVATHAAQPLDADKQFLLRMAIRAPMILRNSGIDAVTLANNHSMDFGYPGLQDTLRLLDEADLLSVGAGIHAPAAAAPLRISLGDDRRICILSFSRTLPSSFWAKKDRPGTAYASAPHVIRHVRACAASAPFTIVIFHWGQEHTRHPMAYQRALGRAAIDAGAQIVVGHHAHMLQDIEVHQGRLILHSIGNFVFGTDPKHSVPEGLAVRLRLNAGAEPRNFAVDLVPLDVRNDRVGYVPRVLEARAQDSIRPRLPQQHPCHEVVGSATEKRHWTCLIK